MKTTIEYDDLPLRASIAEWSRAINVSQVTLAKHFKSGALQGHKKLNGITVISREAICELFNIRKGKRITVG